MIQEVLVFFACMNNVGCNETSKAYYENHPELKEIASTAEKKVKDFIGPTIVQTIAPFWFVAAGGSGNLKIYGNFSLEIHQFKDPKLLFTKNF